MSPEVLLDEKTKVGVLFSDKNNPTLDNCIAAVTSSDIIDENNKYTVKLEGLPDCRKTTYYRSYITKSGNTLYGKVRTITQSPCKAVGTMTYVDLGLPSGTKWAKYYMGASSEKQAGKFYQWGQIEIPEYGKYTWANYKWCAGPYPEFMTKYCPSFVKYGVVIDDKYELDYEDDIAHMTYGANWRTPSYDQFQELIDECTWTYEVTTLGYSSYYTLTATGKNGNSIVFTNTGYYNSSEDRDKRFGAGYPYCWTRSLVGTEAETASTAYSFQCYMGYNDHIMHYMVAYQSRYHGACIRPVYNDKD